MTRKKAELLMAFVIILRSTSLLFSKICLGSMGPLTLLGIRFVIAFAFLLIFFRKQLTNITVKTLLRSMLVGAFFFGTMVFELLGLSLIDSSTTSFLENTSIILVPIINAMLLKSLPKGSALVSGAIALCGVAFLTLKSGQIGFSKGEIFCLIAAFFYALSIISTDRMAEKEDPIVLGVLQIGFIGIIGTVSAFIFEQPALPTSAPVWGSVIALAIICTGFGFTFQPVAQKYMPADKAGLFCALNPLVTSTLGIIFLGEHLGRNGLIGAAMILASIIVSALLEKRSAENGGRILRGLPQIGHKNADSKAA